MKVEAVFYQARHWLRGCDDSVAGVLWPSSSLGHRLPGRNDVHTEKMKEEREIAKEKGCGEGLKETSRTDRIAEAEKRSTALQTC